MKNLGDCLRGRSAIVMAGMPAAIKDRDHTPAGRKGKAVTPYREHFVRDPYAFSKGTAAIAAIPGGKVLPYEAMSNEKRLRTSFRSRVLYAEKDHCAGLEGVF